MGNISNNKTGQTIYATSGGINGTGNYLPLSLGSSGQVLTVSGTSIIWATASGGGGGSGTSGTSGISGTSGTSGLLSLTGTTNNGVITLNGTAPNGNVEDNMTFDGTNLQVKGNISGTSSNIVSVDSLVQASLLFWSMNA